MWFYTPGAPLRTLAELQTAYHNSVGRNAVLELDFAINRDGLVEPSHAALYAAFGDWVAACYRKPALGEFALPWLADSVTYILPAPAPLSRVVLVEELAMGQSIVGFTVEVAATVGGAWAPWSSGQSIGSKRIDIAAVQTVAAVRVTVTAQLAPVAGLHVALLGAEGC